MIRLVCPECEKTLNVADAHAGKVGTCPACKARFTVPNAPEPQALEEAEPPARRRRKPEVDEEGDDECPARKRKRKKPARKSGSLAWYSGFTARLVDIAVVTAVLVVLSLFISSGLAFILLGLWAVLLSTVGAVWFAVVTFQDSVTEFLLCAFVPFYSLYYILTHFEEVKRPLLVQFLCFVPTGIAVLIIAKRGFVL